MRLLPLLVLAGLGFAARSLLDRSASREPRIAGRLPGPGSRQRGARSEPAAAMNVRQAGPEQMRDPPRRWDAVDEAADESFPASDPAARY